MTIYVVKNERNEEVSSYTDLKRAKYFAEQLQFLFFQHYRIEELVCESKDVGSRPDTLPQSVLR